MRVEQEDYPENSEKLPWTSQIRQVGNLPWWIKDANANALGNEILECNDKSNGLRREGRGKTYQSNGASKQARS